MRRLADKTLTRATRWVDRRRRRPHEPHGLVLLYHRVATATIDPWRLCVGPRNFETQLRALRGHFDVVPLRELRASLRAGRRSRPVVSITFDDGYVDNLAAARPLLERFDAPATVCVITGFLGRPRAFWWDALADLLLAGHARPARLELAGEHGPFVHEDAALGSPGPPGDAARRRLHDRLWDWISLQSDDGRTAALESLGQWAGATAAVDPERRPMTASEVLELARGGLVDIGAHTVTHPRLSRLDRAAQAREIEASRADCERLLGRPPACFSYPNGDHDGSSRELVRGAGFALACGSSQDLVWSDSDAYLLPRISVRDESGDALLRRLRWEWLA